MKQLFFICFICCVQVTASQSYQKIHKKAILVDSHNDILTQTMEKGLVFDQDLKGKSHSDLVRWEQGGLDVQLFSVWCDGNKQNPFAFANRQMDTLDAVVARNPDKIVEVANRKAMLKAVHQHKLAAMFGIEGGHMIEDKLDNLNSLYKRGARYMTLTWNNSTTWATSALEETTNKNLQHKGLTDFGKQVIKRMNDLGMIVDISHVGEQTFYDAIAATTKPVIASHSSVYSLCPVFRNLKDDQIKAVAKNGGVIQVNFYSGFLDSNYEKRSSAFAEAHKVERDSLLKINPEKYFYQEFLFNKYPEEVKELRAPLALLIQHIEYIINLVGIDYVGIGSDFDGIESPPQQLDDVTTYPLITKALVEKGYSKKD
ncbi:MAG: membrane dipeptidase, partial [Pedobacter sp.]|nr:membrane dipeptidase [Chitinophagaceae bacterium]